MTKATDLQPNQPLGDEQLPYEAPQVITYTDEQILLDLGPAQANNSPVGGSVL